MDATEIGREACPSCGKDNLARYDDGHAHCFSGNCGHWEPPVDQPNTSGGKTKSRVERDWKPLSGHYADLPKRSLREEDLKKWQYQLGEGRHIMNWKDEKGELVGQKYRLPGKEFAWVGEGSDMLYGMWLWGSKGKSITITEGELDAISVSRAFGHKYPVVSLPNGAGSVKKTLKRCYEYLCGFDKIVLMFDMDDPGRKAVDDAIELLPAGKVFVANLPEKDANETLIKHGEGAVSKAFWDAKQHRPDGIVMGSDIALDDLMTEEDAGYKLRLPDLDEKLFGLRKGEITLWTAGSGIGKSTMLRQLFYELKEDYVNIKLGNMYLEEKNKKTAQAYIALDNNIPLGRLRRDKTLITPEQWLASKKRFVDDMCFYDHFGSLESDRLISKLHYMATVLKCDFIALDHISIVTSGLESSSEGERKDIDILMTRLRSLVEETGVGVLGVVHLKRSQGKNFNEGSAVSLTDLRGSASLEQLSDNVISLERDQQGVKEDATPKDVSLIRVLKCRETGDTGESDSVRYNRDTGRLVAVAADAFREPPVGQSSQEFAL